MVTFMIAAHTQPELFKRLVNTLQAPGTHIVAHIDKKASEEEFKSGLADKVYFLENRRKINWGGGSSRQDDGGHAAVLRY